MMDFSVISVEEQERRILKGSGMGYAEDGSVIDESVYIYEYNDLYMSKNNLSGDEIDDLNVSQPCVLINIHDVQYFHFINDGIASFLLMSKIIPNLKIVLLTDQFTDYDMSNFLEKIPQDFVRSILGWLKDDGLIHDIVNMKRHSHILFDKVFVLSSGYDINAFAPQGYSEAEFYLTCPRGNVSLSNSDSYFKLSAPFIRNYVTLKAIKHNRLPDDFDYPKKIFLSPGYTMSRFWSWEKQIQFLIDNGTIISSDGVIESDPNGAFYKLAPTSNDIDTIYHPQWGGFDENVIRGKVHDITQRSISEKDLSKLEAFFVEQGYLVVDSRDYVWLDVINMCMRAETIAVYAGAASVYAMMAASSTQIIYINPNTSYAFGHSELLSNFFKDPGVIEVFSFKEDPNTNFGVDRVIQELLNNHMDKV
jgi:hypothetical protein